LICGGWLLPLTLVVCHKMRAPLSIVCILLSFFMTNAAEPVQKAIALQNMQAKHMGLMLTHLNPTETNGVLSGDCVFMLLPSSTDLIETELGILISELKVAGEHPCSMRTITNHTEIVVTPKKLPELVLVITPTGKGTLSKKENGVVYQIGLVEFAKK
jgi:hypothetical protein